MTYEASPIAVVLFLLFVGFTLGLSFWLGRKAKSSEGYFAAHGQIPWFVNGIAFAGDYLSAASFLGICGMIAFYGYDGFLYSIGFLAGWIVALFVVAEPMKRLGKFTFADALDSRFNSRGIKLSVGISTLVVSVFYLIPQMVGAGALITPLLGFPHWVGVLLVGVIVTLIVVTAGMVSTTWVQFLKGSLLVLFSAILTIMILNRGFEVPTDEERGTRTLGPYTAEQIAEMQTTLVNMNTFDEGAKLDFPHATAPIEGADVEAFPFVRIWNVDAKEDEKAYSLWQPVETDDGFLLKSLPWILTKDGETVDADVPSIGHVSKLPDGKTETGPLGPLEFFSTLQDSEVALTQKVTVETESGTLTVIAPKLTPGAEVLRPGEHPRFAGIRKEGFIPKLNFLSLMLALFCGTASLPHILIRYYTVKDESSARKSTIVGIFSIGFFYILTLYLGLGAMTSGSLDPMDSNMAAPLLAKSMNEWLFAAISAIAFTTVLGTVSGLILASAGAVSHDLMVSAFRIPLTSDQQVRVAKIASMIIGGIAILLGIQFRGLNVGYLVGWAFSVAASANLPSLIMLLFWKKTTKQGIVAAVTIGMIASLGWILLSEDTFTKVYGMEPGQGVVPFSQPGIVTIPLGFLVLVVVSLMTQPKVEDSP